MIKHCLVIQNEKSVFVCEDHSKLFSLVNGSDIHDAFNIEAAQGTHVVKVEEPDAVVPCTKQVSVALGDADFVDVIFVTCIR